MARCLAASAPNPEAALALTGAPAVVDAKLDGVRIQVHRDGDDVAVFSRSLEDITARVPEVVAAVRSLPVRQAVLDGEVIALDRQGRPRPFQEISGRAATRSGSPVHLTPFFFDALHLDGADLLDSPLAERVTALARACRRSWWSPAPPPPPRPRWPRPCRRRSPPDRRGWW